MIPWDQNKNLIKIYLVNQLQTFLLLVALVFFSICCSSGDNISQDVEFEAESRAFFVQGDITENVSAKNIVVSGSLADVVDVVSEVIRNVTDTTISIVRLGQTNSTNTSKQPVLKVVSSFVDVDTMPNFKKYFNVGSYIFDEDGYEIKPEELSYRVEAAIMLSGINYQVEFRLIGSIDWNVYKKNKKGVFKKMSRKEERELGIGEYRIKKEINAVSRIGEPLTTYEWIAVKIEDQPISRYVIEKILYDNLIEAAAKFGLYASAVYL